MAYLKSTVGFVVASERCCRSCCWRASFWRRKKMMKRTAGDDDDDDRRVLSADRWSGCHTRYEKIPITLLLLSDTIIHRKPTTNKRHTHTHTQNVIKYLIYRSVYVAVVVPWFCHGIRRKSWQVINSVKSLYVHFIVNKEYLILPVAGFDVAVGILWKKRRKEEAKKKRDNWHKTHTHHRQWQRERLNDVKIS